MSKKKKNDFREGKSSGADDYPFKPLDEFISLNIIHAV
jgi:hypothetical protein